MKKIKKAGLDNGNYAMKLWVGGSNEAINIPTVVSLHVGESTFMGEQPDVPIDNLLDNIDVTINSKAIKQNGRRYIVGKKVVTEGLIPEELENHSDKSEDDITAILGLTGLAMHEIRENYDQDNIKATYEIALSLPITTISLEKAENYAKRFIGTHEIIFHHPSGRNQTVTLIIRFARTLPEGSAGSWGIIYNEDGSTKEWTINDQGREIKRTLEDDILLHFDIGAGTIEEVVTNGVAFVPTQSEGHNFGVKTTIENIRKQWNYLHKNQNEKIDSVTEFNSIYFDKENPRNANLVSISKQHLEQLANRISKMIINKIDFMKTKPTIFIYGGGSIILEDFIREELRSKNRIDRVLFLNDPISVTAKGLLVYTSSPMYEKHKQDYLGENK